MVVVVFKNKLRPDIDRAEYEKTFGQMYALASQMPGFISIEGFTAPDGVELAVVKFESDEAATAWRKHPEHVKVQQRARKEFYESYSLTVGEVIREYSFD